jgi:hypothetical protein
MEESADIGERGLTPIEPNDEKLVQDPAGLLVIPAGGQPITDDDVRRLRHEDPR